MNFFRLLADLLHLLSFVIIIYKLHKTKNCKGVSCKTQELYLIVFYSLHRSFLIFCLLLQHNNESNVPWCNNVHHFHNASIKAHQWNIQQRRGRRFPSCLPHSFRYGNDDADNSKLRLVGISMDIFPLVRKCCDFPTNFNFSKEQRS